LLAEEMGVACRNEGESGQRIGGRSWGKSEIEDRRKDAEFHCRSLLKVDKTTKKLCFYAEV
jgi:hypothetical protein